MVTIKEIKKFLKDAGFKEPPDFETYLLLAPSSHFGKPSKDPWSKKFDELFDASFLHTFKQLTKRSGTEKTCKELDDLIVHCDLE